MENSNFSHSVHSGLVSVDNPMALEWRDKAQKNVRLMHARGDRMREVHFEHEKSKFNADDLQNANIDEIPNLDQINAATFTDDSGYHAREVSFRQLN
jgi:accessory colonization factor AcfC